MCRSRWAERQQELQEHMQAVSFVFDVLHLCTQWELGDRAAKEPCPYSK